MISNNTYDDDEKLDEILDNPGKLSREQLEFLGRTYFGNIARCRRYEQPYISDSILCYKLYMSFTSILNEKDNTYDADISEPGKVHTKLKGNMYNIFFSNVQTLQALTGTRVPKVTIGNRINYITDQRRKIANMVTDSLEKIVNYFMSTLRYEDFMRFKLDWLVTGRGVLWVSEKKLHADDIRYNVEYVNWSDFSYDIRSHWESVEWVARRIIMSESEVKKFIGDKKKYDRLISSGDLTYQRYNTLDERMPWNFVQGQQDLPKTNVAVVWEVYDRAKKIHIYISNQLKTTVLKYEYSDFFPTVEPLLAMPNGYNLIPRSEITTYAAQAQVINETMKARAELIKSIIPKGFAPSNYKDLIEKLNSSSDYIVTSNEMTLPEEPIQFIDNRPKTEAIQVLTEDQELGRQTVNELTGLSDVMKNKEVPDETATATNRASHYGEIRLKPHQEAIKHYMQHIFEHLCKLIAKNITAKELTEIAGLDIPNEKQKTKALQQINQQIAVVQQQIQMQMQQAQAQQEQAAQQGGSPQPAAPQPPQQPQPQQQPDQSQQENPIEALATQKDLIVNLITIEDVVEIIKKANILDYIIEVSSDDLTMIDSVEKAQANVNFINSFTQSITATTPIMTQYPALADLFKAVIAQSFDNFNLGREQRGLVEESLDKMVEDIRKKAQNPQPEPKALEAQARMLEAQARMSEAQAKTSEIQLQAQELNFKYQIEVEKLKIEKAKVAGTLQVNAAKVQADGQGDGGLNKDILKAQQDAQKLAMQHEHEMEILMQKEKLAQERAAAQNEVNINLTKTKIAADDNRMNKQMEVDKVRYEREQKLKEAQAIIDAEVKEAQILK